MKPMDKREAIWIKPSGGNVFADLDLPHAEEAQAKVLLALAIKRAIEARALTQAAAGELMGESQPNVSMIVGGKVGRFSLERLMRCARALGYNMRLVLEDSPSADAKGRLIVTR